MRRRPGQRWWIALGALTVVAGLVAAGCSSSQSASKATTTIAPSTTASTAPTTTVPATTVPPTTAPPTTTTTAAPVTPVWAACGNGFECATVTAPLDWDRPEAGTTKLAVTRLPASGPAASRIGTLFVNPGGPGASATDLARVSRNFLRSSVLSRFDVVGVDPRGTGGSTAIVCAPGPELDAYFAADPTPDNAEEKRALIAANQRFADQCFKRHGDFLSHVDTRTAARDMDLVRAALGEEKISYMGFSYGTFLGAMYADLFPARVRAFVLDGALDPAISVDQINKDQAEGFEKAFNAFLEDCKAKPTCPLAAAGDPRAVFDQLNDRVDANPIPVGARSLGSGHLFLAVVSALYRQGDWPKLASALHAAYANNAGATLLAMADQYSQRRADGSYGTLLSANAAVNCIDRPWSKNIDDYEQDAVEFSAQSPEFGAALAYGGLACAYWKVPSVDEARPLRATGAPPIVVIGTTGDPATPYKWSEALASQLDSGVLLTHVGQGHTSLGSPNTCISNAVTNYMVSLTVPAAGTRC